jgi:hypothetical protein
MGSTWRGRKNALASAIAVEISISRQLAIELGMACSSERELRCMLSEQLAGRANFRAGSPKIKAMAQAGEQRVIPQFSRATARPGANHDDQDGTSFSPG